MELTGARAITTTTVFAGNTRLLTPRAHVVCLSLIPANVPRGAAAEAAHSTPAIPVRGVKSVAGEEQGREEEREQ